MSVWVLCPNGHRVQVNVAPSTPLNSVKQQACEKQGFSPGMYGLRRESQKRSLDLSLPFRLSGIPNKAKLELFEEEQRVSEVKVALQFETGERVLLQIGNNASLWDTIHTGRSDVLSVESVTYLQQRITQDKLNSVTLAELGIFKGSVMLRLQGVNQPASAASPAEVPGITQVPTEECGITQVTTEELGITLVTTEESGITQVTIEESVMETESLVADSEMEVESKAILYNPSSNSLTSSGEEPDDFYQLNDRDLKLMLRDLHRISERQLRLKEPQKEKEVPDSVIFRIRFPNGLVLQNVFKTADTTTDTLYSFVESYLTPATAPHLALFQAPPKRVIRRGAGLGEEGLLRTTLLHAAGGLVLRDHLTITADTAHVESQIAGVLGDRSTATQTNGGAQPGIQPGANKPGANKTGANKPVPKWFKL